jgi:hypothetical protein
MFNAYLNEITKTEIPNRTSMQLIPSNIYARIFDQIMIMLGAGHNPPRRNKKYMELNKQIEKLTMWVTRKLQCSF